jgi:hypothetical protein
MEQVEVLSKSLFKMMGTVTKLVSLFFLFAMELIKIEPKTLFILLKPFTTKLNLVTY